MSQLEQKVNSPFLASEFPDRTPFPASKEAFAFVQRSWLAMVGASAALLVPCFWHRHIQATDLGSHVYNAWLAQLIQQGKAPGLHIVPQTSNVLFDLMLSILFQAFGPIAAERIAVSITVLLFFWGGFALCTAVAGSRSAWVVSSLLAMICYGFIFNTGFFNCYLSVGLSLFGLAVLWRGSRWDYLLLVPLGGLIWMSHLLGAAGFVSLGAFLLLSRRLRLQWQLLLTSCVLVVYSLGLWYVLNRFPIVPAETNLYWMLGADQFVTYSWQYGFVSIAVLIACAIALTFGWRRSGREAWLRTAVWLQLWAIIAIAVFFAPGGVLHPKLHFMGYLPDRASLYSAVLMCVAVAAARPSKMVAGMLGVIAIAFFALLYRDTAWMDVLEAKVEKAIVQLEPGDLVLATILLPAKSRIHEQHAIDRACIGRCFNFGNYEPASGQFRIKADPNNRIVLPDQHSIDAVNEGRYAVQPQDLPIHEVYSCGPTLDDICVHQLRAGELNAQVVRDVLMQMAQKQQGRHK